ncbi:ABC transporter permease subunit [Anaerosphaera multitolerans]|uniref:ABC transporter permease n=1 Tax=Anaerosphaera multitolerans TaxID=2487351 RepID=A0A437S5J5_9FIRM|nr:ABC transporter permease subunit [Anaerosphaera multitolerans]RVU54186.1 hypothetical protein EF514_08920 [Anaerosphaera multitolerans]
MVFSKEFKSNMGKMIAWILVLTILIGLLFALYPMMLDINMKSMFDTFVESLTPNLKLVLGLDESVDYTNLGQYIAFIFQYIAVLVAMFSMQLGGNSLSKEQEYGTIQYLYSNPISRNEIISQKILANILTYILFLFIIIIITFGLSYAIPIDSTMNVDSAISTKDFIIDLVKIFVALLGSGLVYMSIGFFLSSISKSASISDGVSVIFVLITVVLIMAGKVFGSLFFNIIDMLPLEVFKPFRFVVSNFSLMGIGVNIIVIVVFMLLTYLIYNSKDLYY